MAFVLLGNGKSESACRHSRKATQKFGEADVLLANMLRPAVPKALEYCAPKHVAAICLNKLAMGPSSDDSHITTIYTDVVQSLVSLVSLNLTSTTSADTGAENPDEGRAVETVVSGHHPKHSI